MGLTAVKIVPLVTWLPQERVPPLTSHKPMFEGKEWLGVCQINIWVRTLGSCKCETIRAGFSSVSSTSLRRPFASGQQTADLSARRDYSSDFGLGWHGSTSL